MHQWFACACPEVHAGPVHAVLAGGAGLLRGQRLWPTAIGRPMNGRDTAEKHGVKRADRLLGNGPLSADRSRFYRCMAQGLTAPESRPVLLID